jgi:hypothetical protein
LIKEKDGSQYVTAREEKSMENKEALIPLKPINKLLTRASLD